MDMLKEWRRVLKPEARIVLELPCMDKVFKYMSDRIANREPMHAHMSILALWGDPKHERLEMCHRWGYTKAEIRDVMREAGFKGVETLDPRYHVRARDMRVEGIA